jgi:hypothetical protein
VSQILIIDHILENFVIVVSTFYVTLHIFLKSFIAHFGATLTIEAEEVKIVLSKLSNSFKDPLMYHEMLVQVQTRDLRVQNIFFVIDWKFVLTVRIIVFKSQLIESNFFLQTTSTIVTYLVITCQFQTPGKN